MNEKFSQILVEALEGLLTSQKIIILALHKEGVLDKQKIINILGQTIDELNKAEPGNYIVAPLVGLRNYLSHHSDGRPPGSPSPEGGDRPGWLRKIIDGGASH